MLGAQPIGSGPLGSQSDGGGGYAGASFGIARSIQGLAVDVNVTVARSVRNYVTGTASAARSIRAAVAASVSLARSVRGYASGSTAIARSIAAAGVATATVSMARSVRGYASSSATLARSISATAVVSASVSIARRIGGYVMATAVLRRSIDGDSAIIWPATRAGEANTARVPFDGVRVIVHDADDEAAPVKVLPLYLADTERVLIDFEAKYLAGAGDTAATLLAVDAPPGLLVTPDLPVGSALASGVVAISIAPATTAGTYRLAVQIRTTGGRECTGLLDVLVSASVQPTKTFRLRSAADRDVFELDYAAKYLAGTDDEAASLLGVVADAGITADARLDAGGVVQLAVDNPAAAGTYQVRTQLLTAAGRRKTGAIAVEVLA